MAISIRAWRPSEAGHLARMANNSNIAKMLTDSFPSPYSLSHAEAFIEKAGQDLPPRLFAIDLDGQAVGAIGLHPQGDIFRRNIELGYWLAEEFWGRGIASGAVALAVGHAFAQFDIDRVFARPFGNNIGSQKVLEKNGFALEARFEKTLLKNGELHDELVYAVRRAQWEAKTS